MPRAKRDKEVSLTKTKKKTKESKVALVNEIKRALNEHTTLFVLNFENLRSKKFTEIRQELKADSKFFLGKKTIMALALGRSVEDETEDGLHKVTDCMEGQCGLLFTKRRIAEVIKYFHDYEVDDYARSGATATRSITLPAGPLTQFAHSIEPQLRKLGLPTKIERGTVTLHKEYTICEEGDTLTPEQCKILKMFGEHMCRFHVNLVAYWTKKKGVVKL